MFIFIFTWTDSLITWKSYEGTDYPGTNLIASWRFDKNNQARTKLEGGKESNPIVGELLEKLIEYWSVKKLLDQKEIIITTVPMPWLKRGRSPIIGKVSTGLHTKPRTFNLTLISI